ncbi:MAG: peptidase M23 family protein [Candidatus Peregrinibacteria bacterium GW2011_GWF2_33_10]|nr:MAG: peptidase M23 family protein [Candidatus Peregrinibacteria bacterium GW2011_GWF2_33_10]
MKIFNSFKFKKIDHNSSKCIFENLITHLEIQTLPSQEKLFYVVTILSVVFLFLSSFQFDQNFGDNSIPSAYAMTDPVFLDDDGYLIKSMPVTSKGDYSNRKEAIGYEVQRGDTVSEIATIFGLKVSTVLENNPFLGGGELLKIGQNLIILPSDGLLYEIQKSDTFSSIAKKYSINEDDIKTGNNISALIAGQKILLPGARLPRPVYIAQTASVKGNGYVNIGTQIMKTSPSNSGIINPVPVNGRYSRGPKGHGYAALDISRPDKSWLPNIVAACDGVVKIAKGNGYNGGYGLYVSIHCDNGYDVLTAHNSQVYVQVGDRVAQGQIIAKMGETGRATGVHSHIEIQKDGVKLNPLNFFSVPGL